MFFSYDPELSSIARKVPGSTYSKTFKCWYVDDNEDNLKQIFTVLREHTDIDISEIASTSVTNRCKAPPETEVKPEIITAVKTNQVIEQHQPEDGPAETSYPVPSPAYQPKSERAFSQRRYGPVEFTIDEADDKLIIKFLGRYDPAWIKEMRSFGRAWFDPHRLEWVLDWSRLTVDSLSDYFSMQDVEVIVRRNEVLKPVKDLREEKSAEIRDRMLSKETIEGMENLRRYLVEKRYSINTIEAYISLLGLFFKYFLPKAPYEITEEDISDFFHDYILFHKYSASYQNQIISAIKLYYILNGSARIETSSLGRPRKSRALPKVFSKEEVKSILNSTRNIKHRLLLWLIYSCGLRRTEVTMIKIKDLDRERSILNIVEAKGRIDRIVPVSGKVWEKIDEYIESYHPVFWLFEGQKGGKYSSESVYRVFKQALKNAGINKEVGVHCLRHSYATY